MYSSTNHEHHVRMSGPRSCPHLGRLDESNRPPCSAASPFGLNFAEDTGGLSPLSNMVLRQCPLCVSQMRSRPSRLLESSRVPSWQKSTAVTGSECAGTSRKHFPLRTSHTRIVSSNEPEAWSVMYKSGGESDWVQG